MEGRANNSSLVHGGSTQSILQKCGGGWGERNTLTLSLLGSPLRSRIFFEKASDTSPVNGGGHYLGDYNA